jgi:DNA-binding PadR family transcriptional regulator
MSWKRWELLDRNVLQQIEAEGNNFMPSQAEWTSTQDLEMAGLIEEAFFAGGGAITYRITEKGRQWLHECP